MNLGESAKTNAVLFISHSNKILKYGRKRNRGKFYAEVAPHQLTRKTGESLDRNGNPVEPWMLPRNTVWKGMLPYALIEFLKQYVDAATLRSPMAICAAVSGL